MTSAVDRRKLLAAIARREGELKFQADANQAGPQVEKYLCVFRQVIFELSGKKQFLDFSQGYDWCCAFVYYCCQKAGYEIPLIPFSDFPYTLAVVCFWEKYARKRQWYHPREEKAYLPQAGNLVIFDKIVSNSPSDHIGIVLDDNRQLGELITAEGNVNQSTGIFKRKTDHTVRGYIALPF